MAETTVSPQALREGYEPDDIRVGGVVLAGAAALVVLALTLLVLWGLVALLSERSRQPLATSVEQTPIETPAPRLQADPGADLAALRAAEDASLHRWAWVDRQAGIVQIPIEQAMAELARRGWPQPDRQAPLVPPRAEDGQPSKHGGRRKQSAAFWPDDLPVRRQAPLAAAVALWLAWPGLPAADDLPDPAVGAAIEPRLGAQVPAEAMFVDEAGKPVRLGDYLGGPPVILAPVYYACPNLCGSTLADLAAVLRRVPLTAGTDYRVVAVSIDPREQPADAARAKARTLAASAPPVLAASMHFLTGPDAPVRRLMHAIGFCYRWDEQLRQYTHLAGIGVLTGDGRLARWLPGIGLEPTDLRLAIAEAGRGGIAGLADSFLLLCSHYDPQTGRYTPVVTGILKIAGILTVLALAAPITLALVRERRRQRAGGVA